MRFSPLVVEKKICWLDSQDELFCRRHFCHRSKRRRLASHLHRHVFCVWDGISPSDVYRWSVLAFCLRSMSLIVRVNV